MPASNLPPAPGTPGFSTASGPSGIAPIPAEMRERIVQAAVELFEGSGRVRFPSVDQVRRLARVDMNAASTVMREWRRAQTMQAGPVAVQIPEGVVTSHTQALAGLWLQAQELANESLRAAQASWETERGELDAMRQEIAAAFEVQVAEFEQFKHEAQAREDELKGAARQLALEESKQRDRAERAEARLQAAIEAHEARVKAVDADRAKTEAERDRLRDERTALAGKLSGVEAQLSDAERRANEDEGRIEEMKVEEKERRRTEGQQLARLEADREEARQSVIEARERAATLEGRLATLQEQNAALLACFGPASPAGGGGKVAGKR